MRYFTIDTSVFVSAVDQNDPFNKTTLDFFKSLNPEKDRIIIPITIIIELVNLVYKMDQDHQKMIEYFNDQPHVSVIPIDDYFYENYWVNFTKFNLRAGDLIIALTSFFHQTQLITWDKQFLKDTRDLCDAMMPKEFLKNIDK